VRILAREQSNSQLAPMCSEERRGGRGDQGVRKGKEIKKEEGGRDEGGTSHYDCGSQA